MDINFSQILVLCCVVPFFFLVAIGLFIFWNFRRFLRSFTEFSAPDTEALHRQFEALRARHPKDNRSQLIRRMINQHAMRQGMVGALTSFGGVLTLPLGLTIDLAYSARSNAALSFFIAQAYGIENERETLNLGQLLVARDRNLSRNEIVMWQEQFGNVAYRQFMEWALRKTVAKIVPFAGAVIGFLVNWSSVQLFGRAADAYYARTLGDDGIEKAKR